MASEWQTGGVVRGKRSTSIAMVGLAVMLCGIAVIAAIQVAAPSRSEPASTSIGDTIPTAEPDAAVEAALIVLKGATMLRRDHGAYGSYHVAYGVTEKHRV